jgi:hypothetical protein
MLSREKKLKDAEIERDILKVQASFPKRKSMIYLSSGTMKRYSIKRCAFYKLVKEVIINGKPVCFRQKSKS